METQISLSHLVTGRENVRRTNPLVDIPVLAALIRSQGLLQRLLVRDNGEGKYRVIDGKRRRAAIRLLVAAGDWPKGKLVPVMILSAEQNDTEVSLAANLGHVDMHPADTFEAFRHLMEDEGASPEAIGDRFGYAVSTVSGFLKLANVSPKLMKAFRKDELSLEQMKALAITDDHKRQEIAFFDSPDYLKNPRDLRRLIMEGRIETDDKFVRFVGLDAYEAAGGAVTRDLFGDAGESWIEDSGLLHRLANARMEAEATAFREKGWKWVEVKPDLTGADIARQQKVSLATHGFAPDSETARLYAGVILGVGQDGQLNVVAGVLKSDDAKALSRARKETADTPIPSATGHTPSPNGHGNANGNGGQLAANMVEELTAIRTAALQLEVARRPDVGLAIVIHDLALAVFCEPWDNEKRRTEMTPGISDVSRSIPDAETSKVILEMNGVLDGWRNRLPKDARELWPWLLQQEQDTLLELLSVVVAPTINAIHLRHEKHVPPRIASGHRLAQTLGLDMTKYWQADAGFLSRISKSAILSAIAEGVSPEDARSLDRSSKAELVPAAERKLAGSGWLPLVLRTPENVEQPEEVEKIDEDEHDGDDLDRKAAE